MKNSVKAILESGKIPEGETAEQFAARIKSYILAKNKIVRALMVAFSVFICALALFLAFGRDKLYSRHFVVFCVVCALLSAAAVACAAAVAVMMFRFKKFLKNVDDFIARNGKTSCL